MPVKMESKTYPTRKITESTPKYSPNPPITPQKTLFSRLLYKRFIKILYHKKSFKNINGESYDMNLLAYFFVDYPLNNSMELFNDYFDYFSIVSISTILLFARIRA